MSEEKIKYIEPFLKWAGRKSKLLKDILPLIPENYTFIEPFVGSGAVFLNVTNKKIIINDINKDLISTYEYLKNDNSFITYVKSFFNKDITKKTYYDRRTKFNESKNYRERAALFIWLNRNCFNGLCRYNSSGLFNVPQGEYSDPLFPEEQLIKVKEILTNKSISINNLSFDNLMCSLTKTKNEKFVFYLDPPYIPKTETASFTSYSSEEFNIFMQKKLADYCELTALRGDIAIVSNSFTSLSKNIYSKSNKQIEVKVNRSISATKEDRKLTKEYIFIYDKDFK